MPMLTEFSSKSWIFEAKENWGNNEVPTELDRWEKIKKPARWTGAALKKQKEIGN